MQSFQRMKRLCPWSPHVKAGKSPQDPLPLKVPQFAGTPGWLLLSHSEEGRPVALFVDKTNTPHSIPIVLDERLFSDTVFRVIQLKPDVFLVCDIRWLNGVCVYEKYGYSARRALVESLVEEFHQPDLSALLTYDEVPTDALVRGWEVYDDQPGTMGAFLPAKE